MLNQLLFVESLKFFRHKPSNRLSYASRGYAEEVREKAVRMYVEGNNFRRIGRLLGVNHQSVVNWINAYQAKIQNTGNLPKETETIEIDELWSFVGKKKTRHI